MELSESRQTIWERPLGLSVASLSILPNHGGTASRSPSWGFLDPAKPSGNYILEPFLELAGSRQAIGELPLGAFPEDL